MRTNIIRILIIVIMIILTIKITIFVIKKICGNNDYKNNNNWNNAKCKMQYKLC